MRDARCFTAGIIKSYSRVYSRVQACNLNLKVYVFVGAAAVQIDIVQSNLRVQVTNLNPRGENGFLKGQKSFQLLN